MRMLMPILRLLSSFVKASAMFAIVCILLIAVLRLCPMVLTYCVGYSDKGLYSAAKECVVDTIGVDKVNEEARKVFSAGVWKDPSASSFYEALNGSCLDKVCRALPSSGTWSRAMVDGHPALVLRVGWHYNYAWLIIVNPDVHIGSDGSAIRHLADNIVVSCDSGRIKDVWR